MIQTLLGSLTLALLGPLAGATPLPQDDGHDHGADGHDHGAEDAVQVDALSEGELGPLAAAACERWNMPAIACAIVDRDGIVQSGVSGVRVRGRGVPASLEDRWQLGTCSMSFTATLLALFEEEKPGFFDLTLGEAFPGIENMRDEWKAVPVWRLLSHTSGALENLNDIQGLYFRMKAAHRTPRERRQTLLEEVSKRAPEAPAGDQWIFSHAGYVMAAAVYERRTGKSYTEVMRTRFGEDLGISLSFGAPNRREGILQPAGHDERGIAIGSRDNPRPFYPATGINLSLSDWAAFVRLHLRGALGEEGLPLQPATFRRLHTAVETTQASSVRYGLGWAIDDPDWSQGEVLTHNGSNESWYARMTVAPAEGFAVIAVVNQGGPEARGAVEQVVGTLVTTHLQALASAQAEEGGADDEDMESSGSSGSSGNAGG